MTSNLPFAGASANPVSGVTSKDEVVRHSLRDVSVSEGTPFKTTFSEANQEYKEVAGDYYHKPLFKFAIGHRLDNGLSVNGRIKDQYYNNRPSANASFRIARDWFVLKNKVKSNRKLMFGVDADLNKYVPNLELHAKVNTFFEFDEVEGKVSLNYSRNRYMFKGTANWKEDLSFLMLKTFAKVYENETRIIGAGGAGAYLFGTQDLSLFNLTLWEKKALSTHLLQWKKEKETGLDNLKFQSYSRVIPQLQTAMGFKINFDNASESNAKVAATYQYTPEVLLRAKINNTFDYKFGVHYQYSPKLKMMVGIAFDRSLEATPFSAKLRYDI